MASENSTRSVISAAMADRKIANIERLRAKLQVKKGISSAHALLSLIHTTVRRQVKETGDIDIAIIGRLVLQMLPDPAAEEATGFAFVLGEYLAACADGLVLAPDFESLNARAWKKVRHG